MDEGLTATQLKRQAAPDQAFRAVCTMLQQGAMLYLFSDHFFSLILQTNKIFRVHLSDVIFNGRQFKLRSET